MGVGPVISWIAVLAAVTAAALAPGSARDASAEEAGTTLERVRARGHLVCGVSEGTPGFSVSDATGNWTGLDVEFCRAVAAAVLGNHNAVKFRPLSVADRFRALADGDVDVLARSTTWTLSRDTELIARFVGTLFHDGQGFLVRRAHSLTSVFELSGASICVLAGTSAERGLTDFFRAQQMRYQLVSAVRWEELVRAYQAGSCTLLSADVTLLAVERGRFANPADHILLPELVLKEPLGPAVRQGDEQWFSIVRWVLMALINAEELGVSSANADDMRASAIVSVRQFLGIEASHGQGLGLKDDWAYRIVKQVGNYGEVFQRTVGADSTLGLERGFNDLWTRGGLMISAPFR
jgi:general L-amino acid transport system substrate-binding protein